MIAYKFLDSGAVSPFSRFAWPRAGASGTPWVNAPPNAGAGKWIHACTRDQLPYWLDVELWRVELAGAVREERYQLASPRARLVGQVAAWDEAGRAAFAEACAWRARDLAVAHLPPEQGAPLAAAQDLAALEAAARAGMPAPGPTPAGYVAFAATRARAAHPALTALNAAMLAASLAADAGAGFAAERAWQARWLGERLALE